MATFGTWTHPATGKQRVYINNLPGQRGAKIWVEEQESDTFGCTFTIRAQASNLTRGEVGNLQNDAEQALYAAAGARIKSFADVLALAA